MRFLVALLVITAIAGIACGGDGAESSGPATNGDDWLAQIPLAPGAEEVDRTVTDAMITVKYETDAGLQETAYFYRDSMSVAPWRVTTFDVNYGRGSGILIFRNDDGGLIATARIADPPAGGPTVIDLDVLPLIARTPIPSASEGSE